MKRKKKVVVVVMVVVTVASVISQVGPATPHLREPALTDKHYSPLSELSDRSPEGSTLT